MKAPDSNQPEGPPQLPLPGKQFQRFILVFHVVFTAGMCFVLMNRWQRAGFVWGWPEFNVTVLIAAQVAMYIRFFALPIRSPAVLHWWGLYFPVSFALWFITWRFEPAFEWIVLGYLGQLFGAVPPRYSVPGSLAVFLVWLPAKTGLAGLAGLHLRDWLWYLAMVVGWTALGLFIHRLAYTSAERAELIQKLETAKKELELAREKDAELAALRERERLARELHDSLGHGLVTLTVQLEAAQKLLEVDPGRASTLMEDMKVLTRTSMEQLRRSLAGLRAPGLGDRPLLEALEELCSEVAKRSKLRIDHRFPGEARALSPAVCEALWRVAQEGLANVERHAQASEARVSLELDGNAQTVGSSSGMLPQIVMRVTDDGVGVRVGADMKSGHYGLRGLRERVEGLGGTLKVLANTPKGTTLEACLPRLPGK